MHREQNNIRQKNSKREKRNGGCLSGTYCRMTVVSYLSIGIANDHRWPLTLKQYGKQKPYIFCLK